MTTPRIDARSRHKNKPKHCEECGAAGRLWRFRGQWVCDACVLSDEIPPRLEDHMRGFGALGDDSRLDGECSLDYGEKGSFMKALDRALEKHGLAKTKQDLKAEMFAGVKK